jgi:Zn finger protein HypA/HybF involved in hydrogenase expression
MSLMEMLKERERVETVFYRREFWYKKNGSGFSFPCDENGNVGPLNDEAKSNLEFCLHSSSIIDKGCVEYKHCHTEPAIGKCEDCGGEVVLSSGLANQCTTCGTEYNLQGDKLLPREMWVEPIEPEDYY